MTNMLLIGSRAVKYHYSDARNPNDYDFIATTKETESFLKNFNWKDVSTHNKKKRALVKLNGKGKTFEFDLVEHYESSEIIYTKDSSRLYYDDELNFAYKIANPKTLFLLKKSHITYNIHWWKNIYDYLYVKSKLQNDQLNNWQNEAFYLRFNEIKKRSKRKDINFDVSNSDFFKRSEKFVNRVIEHDSLHYATCFYDKPLFLMAKEDTKKAALSPDKIWKMPHKLIIQMIQEEIMALSLERFIIPSLLKKENFDDKMAYVKTAGKMVYNYLPDFLRFYAADHFLEFVMPPNDYVTSFLRRHPTFFTILKGS